MKRLIFPAIALVAIALAPLHAAPATPTPTATPSPAAADDSVAEAQARSSALELAGAFSNDGYKIRDGYYFGTIGPDKAAVIEVNLFAGDEYWFCAAANDPAKKLDVKVYDQAGKPVEQQYYNDGAKAAAGAVAAVSGKYLVKVSLAEGDKSQFSFVYCYK